MGKSAQAKRYCRIFEKEAEETAKDERAIQRKVDRSDQKKSRRRKPGRDAGRRARLSRPAASRPASEKAGLEAELELAPMYDAPHYKGSEKLQDKVALITGGDSGIGRAVAVLFAREGADVAIVYLDEHEDAEETKRAVEKEGRRCILLSGDVADAEFCKDAVEQDRGGVRQARHPGQQRRVPGARQQLRGPDRRALRPDHQDQSLRLFLHGARRRCRI